MLNGPSLDVMCCMGVTTERNRIILRVGFSTMWKTAWLSSYNWTLPFRRLSRNVALEVRIVHTNKYSGKDDRLISGITHYRPLLLLWQSRFVSRKWNAFLHIPMVCTAYFFKDKCISQISGTVLRERLIWLLAIWK